MFGCGLTFGAKVPEKSPRFDTVCCGRGLPSACYCRLWVWRCRGSALTAARSNFHQAFYERERSSSVVDAFPRHQYHLMYQCIRRNYHNKHAEINPGKSTTLGILSGDICPTGGQASIAGYNILTEQVGLRLCRVRWCFGCLSYRSYLFYVL